MIPTIRKPTKSELMRRYDRSEPQFFIQYLGFADRASSGIPLTCVFDPCEDKHGHILLMGDTWELASGQGYGLGDKGDEPAIRVLVKEGTTKAEALALLSKIMVWIEKDGMPN
jgi:hypothetical protein